MIRILVLIALGGLVYWLWKWTMSKYNRFKRQFQEQINNQSSPEVGIAKKSSELVQDPVCKLFIAKETAIAYKDHYFCSEKCKNNFN